MTTYNRVSLKTFFQTNDVPFGTDYANLIDSCLNIVDTAEQSIASTFNAPKIVTSRVSAETFNIATNLIVGTDLDVGFDLTVGDNLDVGINLTVTGNTILNNDLTIGGNFSNLEGRIDTTFINCSAIYITDIAIVSAAGTAQATGTPLTATTCRLQGINDGTATGFILMSNNRGLIQYLVNETAVSANLWPPIGGKINNLATNAVFPIGGGVAYTVIHTQNSAYAVK